MTDPEGNVEAILEAPEMLSSVLVLISAAGRELPKPPLKLLGVRASDVPVPSLFWLERLIDGLLFRQTDSFPLDTDRLRFLRELLNREGLIEGGRVQLGQSRSVFRLMAASLAKLESIIAIAKAEAAALGADLRMVVLSDHIRADELPTRPDADFRPAKLGVVPIFETAAATYAPRALSWNDTLHALCWSAAGVGAMAAANQLRGLESLADFGLIGMGIAGIAVLASLPQVAKAARLAWRNGSLEGALREVVEVTLRAQFDASVIASGDWENAEVEIHTSLDGRKDVVITGVSRPAERQVMQAVAEMLGPVQNQRYLMVRRSRLGVRRRLDYHAVPAALGSRKETAERFAELWRAKIGSSDLVSTRRAEGRRMLLRARAFSFASAFQRPVERRSVWL